MPTTTTERFSARLLQWFDQYGRKDLPWQQNKTAYRVWVSEIMLQQTQVASVIAYYQNFMAHFPTLEALATADTDAVLKHWSGLGYYARARNLHKAAVTIHTELAGDFPDTIEGLCELPGIGRSTAGAILSIAIGQRAPILDGNVKRVLCRHQAVPTWSGECETEKKLWLLADTLTPDQRFDDYTQAIMDLGATLCSRSKPKCSACPVQQDCLAFEQDLQHSLPVSKPKKLVPTKQVWMLHIEDEDKRILSEKRPPTGIWGGLYSLPEETFDTKPNELQGKVDQRFQITSKHFEPLTHFTHVFSHYKLEIHPVYIKATRSECSIAEPQNFSWLSKTELKQRGLPAPIKKFLSKDNPQHELTLE